MTSGYRFVLTYNLIYSNDRRPPPLASFDVKKKELEDILEVWKKDFKQETPHCPEMLVYILEYLYTQPSLSYVGLKGCDAVVGQCLAELGKEHGFIVYLAGLEKGETGECEDVDARETYWRLRDNTEPRIHQILSTRKEWLELKHIVNLEGTELFNRVSLSESQIIQDDPFNGHPDEEYYGGPAGNQGVSATHWYRKSVSQPPI